MDSETSRLGKRQVGQTSKTKSRKTPERVPRLGPEDYASYANLRASIDSFQALALCLYSEGRDPKDRAARARRIRKFVDRFQSKVYSAYSDGESLVGCPWGTYNCNGTCLPMGSPCWVLE